MATGIFHTRDLSRVTHRGWGKGNREPRQRVARKASRADDLREEVVRLVAEDGLNLTEAAVAAGCSKAYAQKLFAQVREALGVPVKD